MTASLLTATLAADAQVGAIVTHHPAAASVFRQHRVDFCCNGRQTLATACADLSLDPDKLLAQVIEAEAREEDSGDARDWTEALLADLCTHIVATHHAYLRTEFPCLTLYIEKIAGVHGDEYPELAELGSVFGALYAELENHMAKEEQILFPMITRDYSAPGLR
jgi:regulator of cell morphogenesis and NO signaling